MPNPQPLDLQATIPDKASAIAFSGGAGEAARIVLDVYAEDPAELLKLLNLRGERLIVRFVKEDDLPRGDQ